jgi:hypothetical protein
MTAAARSPADHGADRNDWYRAAPDEVAVRLGVNPTVGLVWETGKLTARRA